MDIFQNSKNVEELLKYIDNDIKRELSVKRYNHSIGVMKKAEELAKIYNVDINKAKLVGLAHDIGKEIPDIEKLKFCLNNKIKINEIEKSNIGLLHGKIGAKICQERYGFTQDMQNAITYHTTGNENMDKLAKIIFVADKIEDGRSGTTESYMKELEEGRKISKENLDLAVIYEIDKSIIHTIKKGELIHIDSIITRNKIILKNKNH